MVALLMALGLVGAEPPTGASWIWFPEEAAVEGAGQTRYFRLRLELAGAPQQSGHAAGQAHPEEGVRALTAIVPHRRSPHAAEG